MNPLVAITAPCVPELVAAAGERAGMRFLEFFAANIRNPHTRRAYARAADEFLAWCADAGVPSIGAVQPVHVATWIEADTRELGNHSFRDHRVSQERRHARKGRGDGEPRLDAHDAALRSPARRAEP